jgi:hypothetical protein
MGIAAAAAVVAVLLTYASARAVSGQLLVDGPRGPTAVPVGAAVVATVAGALAAWAVARLSARTARPRSVFTVVIAAGLVASSVPPVTAATGATTAWLLLMHLVAAVPLIPAGWRLLPAPGGEER